jgi:hypothetical protein
MRAPDRGPGYSCADFVLVRAVLVPRTLPPSPGSDRRAPEDPGRLDELIQVFRDDRAMSAAVELASPDLARAVFRPSPDGGAQSAGDRPAADRRRMTIALTGYQLRLRHRATPSGMFAGTALIRWGSAAEGGIGTGHRLLLRPGPRWLAGLARVLESDPELADQAPRVRIAAAESLSRIGAMHVQVSRSTGVPGRWEAEKSVRRSRLLDAVLAVAAADRAGHRGIRYAQLLDLLRVSAPGIDREQLARYVGDLLGEGFLATDLLPSPGDPDPLGHVTERLEGHPVAESLRGLRHDLRRVPQFPGAADIRQLRRRLRAVWPPDADVVVDTILNTDLVLPSLVAREVERAASAAWTCAPPLPDRPLAGLHQMMLRRYGADRPVPLAELLDLAGSLGLHRPAWSVPAGEPPPVPACTARDQLLTGLALDALAAGRTELCLDRPLRRRIAAVCGAVGRPPSVDVFAEIVTASAGALERGDFLMVLSSPGAPGSPSGSAAGRLACCLEADAAGLPALAGLDNDDPLDAEVVFRPPDAAAANLVSETGWTRFRIDLTAHPPRRSSRDIVLPDLYVIATARRLLLYSERLGRPIRPVSYSMLHPRRVDAVAGLLLALGRDGVVPWKSWDWGSAAALSWLPRVRVGRAVLAPARWALPPDLRLSARTGTDRQWRDGLRRWQDAEELPEIVIVGAWDQRLPLDLADPVHAALLRRECRDRGVAAVAEPPGGVTAWRTAGWPRGSGGPHTAEFVISLHPRPPHPGPVPHERVSLAGTTSSVPDRSAPAQVYLPGGSWLCVNLTVPAVLQDEVLAELADQELTTAAEQAGADRWFFARTEDPVGLPGLVLRYHGPPRGLHAVLLPALHAWGGRLRAAGLIREFSLASYWPEVWRYGGEGCMEAAERVFHVDSRLCLESLAAMPGTARVEMLAAFGVQHILTALLDPERLVGELPEPRLSTAERRLFAQLRPMVRDHPPAGDGCRGAGGGCGGAGGGCGGAGGGCGGAGGGRLWPDWHTALAEYRSRLAGAARDRAPVAWSLVHMHCNRLAGLSRSAERVAVALACDLAVTRSGSAHR